MIHVRLFLQGINIHQKKESPKGVVNNQILDWSFRLDGVFHNANQDQVFESVASDIVTSALDGYNGKISFESSELSFWATISVK